MTKHIIIVTTTITLIMVIAFYRAIYQAILIMGSVAAVLLTLAGLTALFFGGWYLRERLRVIRAHRIEAEKQAHVMVVTSGNQVFIRETDHKATWRAAHLDPRLYANGSYTEPTPTESHAWEVFNAPRRLPGANPGQLHLPESVEAEPLDLLTVFTQPGLSYAVIGGQQTGKTYQARHIANHWIGRGIKPVVVGPKWDKGEWGGCILLGGNGDFQTVRYGISVIRRIVEARHANPHKSHKEHKILPVFFDDWTPIVDAVDNARALVLEATTLYASVNVLLYFILHSDTASAWGVDRKGAALKDNFVKLFIEPAYDTRGLIVRGETRGYIRFAGEAVDRPARLFSAPPLVLGQARVVTPPTLFNPSEQERQILSLHDAGESDSAIAAAIFKSKGGPQNAKVRNVLTKFGKV